VCEQGDPDTARGSTSHVKHLVLLLQQEDHHVREALQVYRIVMSCGRRGGFSPRKLQLSTIGRPVHGKSEDVFLALTGLLADLNRKDFSGGI
jgi:hypothetical protein